MPPTNINVERHVLDQIIQTPEQQQLQFSKYLYDFGRELDADYGVVPREVNGKIYEISSYKTIDEPFVMFAIKQQHDPHGVVVRVEAYPDKHQIVGRIDKGEWFGMPNGLPPDYRTAIEKARQGMEQGKLSDRGHTAGKASVSGLRRLLKH